MTDDVSDSPDDAADDADAGAVELSAPRRGPLFFTVLTCGFLACMCCVGGVFLAGSIGVNRMHNLTTARETVGVPSGWRIEDSTSLPWRAAAELAGPTDPAAVSAWLSPFDAGVTAAAAQDCLRIDTEPCRVGFELDGFSVTVEYRADADGGRATVSVD